MDRPKNKVIYYAGQKKFVTILHWFSLCAVVAAAAAYQSRTEFGAIINLARQQQGQKDPLAHWQTAPNNGKQID